MAESTPDRLALADGSVVACQETLRSLPGKRLVCGGQRNGRAVIVKRYLDPARAARHARREADGLAAFRHAGIASPEVLYLGSDQDGRPVVVLARIEHAQALNDLFADEQERARLMPRMLELLAEQHAAGICQTDLHLGNFLWADGRIVSLDGAGVESRDGALDEARSLDNLALFFSQLPMDQDIANIGLSAHYARRRGWSADSVAQGLAQRIDAARAARWRERGDKIFRDCSAIVHHRAGDQEAFVVRAAYAALTPLLADIDASCPADPAARLKNGNTATVWHASLGGQAVVVKRYNVKNAWHGLMLTLKESRARISWRNAHRLRLFGIATPAPLACVVRHTAPLRSVAYFLAEAVDGISLRDWVARHADDPQQLHRAAGQVAQLLAQLRRLKISHGDMKAANFLLVDDQVMVIDLDAMRQHRRHASFEAAWRRDMQRFAANWRDRPQVLAVMQDALRAAGVT